MPRRPRICLADLHPVPLVVAVDPTQVDVHHRLKISLYYPRFAIRTYRRPVVVTAPPLAGARVREEVQVARAARRVFSIFPAVPGSERCTIPRNTRPAQDVRGICETSVRSRRTMEPSWSVTFTESWGPTCPPGADCPAVQLTRRHTWQVVEGETIVKPGTRPRVDAIRSRGDTAPQDDK